MVTFLGFLELQSDRYFCRRISGFVEEDEELNDRKREQTAVGSVEDEEELQLLLLLLNTTPAFRSFNGLLILFLDFGCGFGSARLFAVGLDSARFMSTAERS